MINSSLCFNRPLLEANPSQNGITDLIPDDSGFATLATFKTSQLLGFSVKLLDLPAKIVTLGIKFTQSNKISFVLGVRQDVRSKMEKPAFFS
jgi:hypothetical protein